MNPWTRRKGKSDYAEWFPELDLYVVSRWECAAGETHPEHVRVITHVDFVAEENELEATCSRIGHAQGRSGIPAGDGPWVVADRLARLSL